MKPKQWIIVGVVVVAAALLVWLIVFPSADLLTDKAEAVRSVTVTFHPFGNKQVVTVDDTQVQQEIYRLLAQTPVKTNRYPHHLEAQYSNPTFILEITYDSGEVDEIRSTETAVYVFRMLATRGSDGDHGYVGGKNEALADYVMSLCEIWGR